MIVILRPPGRGNWAPVRLDLLMPGKWHLGSVRKGAPPMSKRRRPRFVEHDGGEAQR